MADNRNLIKTVVEWIVDKPSLNKAKKGFDEIKRVNKEVNDLNKRNIQSLKELGINFTEVGRDGVKAFKSIGTEYKALQKLDDDLQDRLNKRDKQFQTLSQNVGLAGDVQSNLGAVQGLLGSAGATGAQQAVAGFGEIAVLAEELPRLKLAFQGMPDVIRATVSAVGAGNLGAIGAIGAFTLAIVALQNESAKRAEALRKDLEVGRNARELASTLSREELEERRDRAQSIFDITKTELARTKQSYSDFNQAVVDEFGVLGAGIAKVNSALGTNNEEFRVLEETIAGLESETKDAETELRALNIALQSTANEARQSSDALLESAHDTAERTRFINETTANSLEQNLQISKALLNENQALADEYNALRKSGDTSESVTARMNELTEALLDNDEKLRLLRETSIPYTRQLQAEADAKKEAEESSKEQEKSAREREQVLSRINRLAEQADSTIARFAERQADFTRQQDQRLQDFDIKRLQDEQDHNRKLLDISRQGTGRIEKLNQSISDSENDYFNSRIKAVRDYADELEQLDDQRNLERIQRERANADDLNELEFENDVIGFLRAERRQAEERRKTNENASLEDKQRAEQFNKRLADDQQAFIQRRALLQRQRTEETLAIAQRVKAEREAFDIQQNRIEQQFNLERDRAQQALDLERQKTQQQLALIQQKAQLEANAVQGTISQIRLLQNAVNQLATSVSQFSGSTRTSSSSSNSNSYQARLAQIQAQNKARSSGDLQQVVRLGGVYASGGIVRGGRPSLNILGDTPRGIDEAVIPFKRSEGIRPALQRAGMNGSGATYLTINATVGENASVSEVKNLINEAVRQSEIKVVRGVASGISSSRFNPQT